MSKKWWKCAVIRALKTVCQSAVALIPAGVAITAVDWKMVAGTAALSGALSILTSLGGIPEAKEE